MKKSFWVLGAHLTVLADQSLTQGRYDLIEGRFEPGTRVPLHLHTRYSEQLVVLEGEFTVQVGEQTHILGVGDTLLIPVNTPHRLQATSTGVARGLTVASPSNFAHLIEQTGSPAASTLGPPAPSEAELARFKQVSEALGDQLL